MPKHVGLLLLLLLLLWCSAAAQPLLGWVSRKVRMSGLESTALEAQWDNVWTGRAGKGGHRL